MVGGRRYWGMVCGCVGALLLAVPGSAAAAQGYTATSWDGPEDVSGTSGGLTTYVDALQSGTTATVTLGGTFGDNASSQLTIASGVTLTLDLDGQTLTIDNAPASDPGISVPTGASLKIEDTSGGGTGTLDVTGGSTASGGNIGAGAGIGGAGGVENSNSTTAQDSGSVAVDSGTVGATGGSGSTVTGGAAGIGGGGGGFAFTGGGGGNSGDVTVAGGSLTAVGGSAGGGIGGGGAGIGGGGGGDHYTGGAGGSASTVEITGGAAKVTGGPAQSGGAGVGGGGGGFGVAGTGGNGGGGAMVNVSGGSLTPAGGASAGSRSGAPGSGGDAVGGGGGGGSSPYMGFGPATAGANGAFGSFTNAGTVVFPPGSTETVPSTQVLSSSGTIELSGTLTGPGMVANTGAILPQGSSANIDDTLHAGPLTITTDSFQLAFDTPAQTSTGLPDEYVYADDVTDSQQTLPMTGAPSGDVFAGWYTQPTGGTQVTDTTNLPSTFGPGPQTVTVYARYAPGGGGGPSIDPTGTTVTCTPTPGTAGAPITCTVTVTDTSVVPEPPTGTVTLTDTLGAPAGTCTLSATSNQAASCQATLTPQTAGTDTITATYPGANRFAAGQATTTLTVQAGSPTTPPTTPTSTPPTAVRSQTPTIGRVRTHQDRAVVRVICAPGDGPCRGTAVLAGHVRVHFALPAGATRRITLHLDRRARRRLLRRGRLIVTLDVTIRAANSGSAVVRTLAFHHRRHHHAHR